MKNTKSTPAAAPQDLWLAGLEAFSQATKAATEAATQAANQAATQVANQVATLAASAHTPPPSLEGLFEARVAKALAKLGTPSRAEVQALEKQVADLRAALRQLTQCQNVQEVPGAHKASKPAKAPSAAPAKTVRPSKRT